MAFWKRQNHGNGKNQGLPGGEGQEEEMKRKKTKEIWGSENPLSDTIMREACPYYICPNPENGQYQE